MNQFSTSLYQLILFAAGRQIFRHCRENEPLCNNAIPNATQFMCGLFLFSQNHLQKALSCFFLINTFMYTHEYHNSLPYDSAVDLHIPPIRALPVSFAASIHPNCICKSIHLAKHCVTKKRALNIFALFASRAC